jgi:ribose 1,5-bisphosphate isomerase
MRWVARHEHPDLILVGAQSITSEGTVLNKIGTKLLSQVASEEKIPFYVATSLLKYNPDTVFGLSERIEMRDPSELIKDWTDAPKELKVLNPGFEMIERNAITGLITEKGIFPPGEVHLLFMQAFPELFKVCRKYNEEEMDLSQFGSNASIKSHNEILRK